MEFCTHAPTVSWADGELYGRDSGGGKPDRWTTLNYMVVGEQASTLGLAFRNS